jgi:hypothetical protein
MMIIEKLRAIKKRKPLDFLIVDAVVLEDYQCTTY